MTSLETVTVIKYAIINSEPCATVSFDINNYLFLLFLEISQRCLNDILINSK